MSEFKFACPVCGQHITADSEASGKRLECPTCFRKIVIPQAPASGSSKLILSAAQADQPRPASPAATRPHHRRALARGSELAVLLTLLGLAGAAFWRWHKQPPKWSHSLLLARGSPDDSTTSQVVRVTYPVPTNISWTLDVEKAPLPSARAAGSINGAGFLCERATLQGGRLSLRQGRNWPPELGVTISLFANQGEDLSGKTIIVGPDRPPPIPRVTLRWKDEAGKEIKQDYSEGYALRLNFGQATNGRMPGQIFIAIPDGAKSFAAGGFDAEIRKNAPPHPPKPSPPAKL